MDSDLINDGAGCGHHYQEFREEKEGMSWWECKLCHTWLMRFEDTGAGR